MSQFFTHSESSSNKKDDEFDEYALLDWINYINTYRRITLFSRLSWIKFWSIAAQLDWLDENHRFFGLTINDDILSLPSDSYAHIGVYIYVFRLFFNLFGALHYIFFSQNELSIKARFYVECKRLHAFVIGDIVSATINLLTNFSAYFKLAAPVVSYLVIALLVFNCLKLIYFYIIEEKKYDEHTQYLLELSRVIEETKLPMLRALQKQLAHQRTVMQWRMRLNFIASLFLLIAFVISVTCAPQILLPLFLYMSVIGSVMFLSSESFGQFMCARNEYQSDSNSTNHAAMIKKRKLFISNMIENLTIPFLLVGLFAINWPAALALTLTYVAVKCYYAKINTPKKSSLNDIPESIRLKSSPIYTYGSFFANEPSMSYSSSHISMAIDI